MDDINTGEWARIWNGAALTCFKVLACEWLDKPHSGYQLVWLRFEPWTYRLNATTWPICLITRIRMYFNRHQMLFSCYITVTAFSLLGIRSLHNSLKQFSCQHSSVLTLTLLESKTQVSCNILQNKSALLFFRHHEFHVSANRSFYAQYATETFFPKNGIMKVLWQNKLGNVHTASRISRYYPGIRTVGLKKPRKNFSRDSRSPGAHYYCLSIFKSRMLTFGGHL
jgi:hypothetical protein